MNLKAIFFDLDDTLVFSEAAHTQAWQITLNEFGIDPNEIDFQSLIGVSDLLQAIQFKERFSVKKDANILYEFKRETFINITQHGFGSPSGRNAFLEKISNTYVTGLVSSSAHTIIAHVLKSEKISSFFNFVIGLEDSERHKPDPLPYQLALARANVQPHEALVIEDSVSGITAAQRASIPVIAILKDQTPEQIIKGVKYFNNFTEIHTELFNKI